ncbi:hypothetical protein CgunFtcFv8_018201 [Champsocephalus gunnari]|uniref:Uncharacterized protein n=1 Tax=Champsocephalus gunnari TaxID=52237 RepID=A0AAN8DNS6_CHAGU|nr:hypothetical protein CgunFtcFv8_018201 [Champsocephalus gunnari]
MDRRSHQNNPRGNPRPFDHGAEADRAYKQIHCRDGQISGLEEYRGAFQEERTKFCHSMRKQKDKVKRLEELLNYRNSGLHKENKKLVDTIVEREAEISRLNGNIENAECQHERQLEDTVALYETQQQKLSDQHNEANLVTLNLLQRREEQLRQCEDKFTKSLAEHTLTWESERQEMEMKLKEVEKKKKYQASRNKTLQTEFQQMEDRLKRQEDKFSKDLADKSRTWETEKQQMETTLNEVTREKNDMAKETLTLETEFKQVEAKLEQVEKEKDRLAENNLGWETDVKQLKGQVREQEEKFAKDLAQNQESWESRVHSVETKLKEVTLEKDDLDQKHQSEMKEVQAKLKMVRDEKKDSAKKNQRMELDLKLKKRLVQLENDLEEQKKKFSKDLAEKQLHWEQFVQRKETDVKQLENQLEEQKKKFSRDLAQNQKSWESRDSFGGDHVTGGDSGEGRPGPETPAHGDQASPDGDAGGGAE